MSIEIKGVIIGEGKPKVCVPIVESHDEAILNKLKEFNELEVDMIELRIDFYENIHQEDALRNLFLNIAALQIQKPVILTIRTAAEGGEVEIDSKDYFNVYKLAVEANAFDIYDVELALGTNMAIELRTLIHDAGKYMLMSSHNFDRTPEVDSLMQKFRSRDSLEADIMKVAVMPEDYQDLLNLLSFTVQAKHEYAQKPIVTMSMSSIGLTSRLVGEQFGSAITFASVGKASAPGQIKTLEKLVWIIYKRFFIEKGKLKDIQIKIDQYIQIRMVLVYKGIETKIHIDARPYVNEDINIDSQGSIRYGFLKLNYAKMLQEWVKDIPQVSVNNTQIRVKNEYLQVIRLNSQEIELELY